MEYSKSTQKLLDQIVYGFRKIIGHNLVGIYLHGSLAMGCFHPKQSDVDFLAVVKDKLGKEEKIRIVKLLIGLSEMAPVKGLEMSIIRQKEIDDFKYPTPFELHFGKEWAEPFLKNGYICSDETDPDLAAHMTVTFHRGVCLFGKPINQVFRPIPEKYYLDSLMLDVKDAGKKITEKPVYFALNLARVLLYVKKGVVSSKAEAGKWAQEFLPKQFKEVITNSLAKYLGEEGKPWNEKALLEYADYMLKKLESA